MKPSVYNVIRRPLVTEKSFAEHATDNIYVFEVDRRASKQDVSRAIQELFKVDVLQVRTLIMRGKVKRFGRTIGKRPNWKKAYVKVRPGQSIPVFEGA